MREKQKITLVITDLDNTLFDWFDIWSRSFKAMFDRLVADSGIDSDVLLDEFKEIYQKHGTSEYAFVIEELSCLKAKHPGEDLAIRYKGAIDDFRKARHKSLKLYPNVLEGLEALKEKGCLLVGYTESMAFYTRYRMRKLSLDRVLDYLYSPADHEIPKGLSPEQIRQYPPEHYKLRRTIHRHTPKGELKPNPKLLLDIVEEIGGTTEETMYIGDSLMKDVAMAQAASIKDVWAKYGKAQDRPEYELLRRVTHWSDEDVEREKELMSGQIIEPTWTLDSSFVELLDFFDFRAFEGDTTERTRVAVDIRKKTVDVH